MKKKKYSKEYTTINIQEKKSFWKDRKKVNLVLIFGIIFIMGFSAVSYSILDSVGNEKKQDIDSNYNDYNFQQENGYWISNIRGNNIQFQYHPSELESIQTPDYTLKDKIYILIDPETSTGQENDIQRLRSLLLTLRQNVYFACTKDIKCDDYPVINCKNTENSIIFIKENNETRTYTEDNCLVLQSKEDDRNKLIERIYYKFTGVIR